MSDRDWFGTTEETQQNKEAEGVAEELSAEAKPSTLPPRRIMADSKLRRVRVLGS